MNRCPQIFALLLLLFALSTAEEKKISLVTCNWEPFYGDHIPQQGFITEIVKQALKERGYDLTVTFTDWPKAVKEAKENTYAGILGAYYAKEREEHFIYSLPIYSIKIIFISRKEIPCTYDGDLHNLKGYTIGVSKGYVYSKEFDEATFLSKKEYSGPEELIEKITEGAVDIVVISSDVAQYLLRTKYQKGASQLKALGPSLTEQALYVPISRKNSQAKTIISDFNSGLKTIIESGKVDSIRQSLMVEELK